jgi:hypothetical protein
MSDQMTPSRWTGRIEGTNKGELQLDIVPVPDGLVAEVYLRDEVTGPASLVGTGQALQDRLEFSLVARDVAQQPAFGVVSVTAKLDQDNRLIGEWHTSAGTAGTFTANQVLVQPAPTSQHAALATATAHERRTRPNACVVDIDVLRRLHASMTSGAEEAARLDHAKRPPHNRPSVAELASFYQVSILVRGAQGELMLTNDPASLALEALPRPLSRVELEIGLNVRLERGAQLPNRAQVVVDFTRPPAFDFSNASGTPTPNDSVIAVYGADPTWVAGVFERLRSTLQQGVVHTGWLHRAYTYDQLLVLIGWPLSLAAGVLVASRIIPPDGVVPSIFAAAVFLLTAIVGLVAFRLSLSLARWLLPYIEFAETPQPLHRQLRVLAATTILGVLASLAAAAVWALFS